MPPSTSTADSDRKNFGLEIDTADTADEEAQLEDREIAEELKKRIDAERKQEDGLGYLAFDVRAFMEILALPNPTEALRSFRAKYIKLYVGAAGMTGVLIEGGSAAELAKAMDKVLKQPFLVHFYPPFSSSAVQGILPFISSGEDFAMAADVSFAVQLYREYGLDVRFLVKSESVKEMLVKGYDIPKYLFLV